ncbi:MAG: peptide chain release factor N(5)-glutamine methyltransferase, partial [Gammaproteobacteria bacterium]
MLERKIITIGELLREGAGRLAGIDSARLDAELLLAHVLERPRSHLYAHPEAPVEE